MVRWPLVRVGAGMVRERGKERKSKGRNGEEKEKRRKSKKKEQAAGRRKGEEEEKEGKWETTGEETRGFRVLFFKRRVEIKYENGWCRWVL